MSKFIKLTSTNNYDVNYEILVNVDNILYMYVEDAMTNIVFCKERYQRVIEDLDEIKKMIYSSKE